MDEKLVKEMVDDIKLREERSSMPVPVGISNRHIHLTKEDFKTLFGADCDDTQLKPVKQPGQYACNELFTLEGPKGSIKDVRMIGPYRKYSQVEVSAADARRLGIEPPIRDSGKLENTPGIKLVGPKGTVVLKKGVIMSKRHIHFLTQEAAKYKVKDGQEVRVLCGKGTEREAIYERVLCRVSDQFALELHLDVEEANAAGMKNGDPAFIV
ncbi:MAG: phosphate propanoyltransferase [Elusimicrobia bacterium]|nr:phosphate propanoyltransferase [Elusimicrobiota bacterium]